MRRPSREGLFLRAAQCYARAGLSQDAARCYQSAGEYTSAAALFERELCWVEAAECWELAELPLQAGTCFGRACRWDDAARCSLIGGEILEGSWLLAHELRRPAQAIAWLERWTPNGREEELAAALIQARCLIHRGEARGAGRTVRQVIDQLSELNVGPRQDQVCSWALAVSEAAGRLDLVAELYACSVLAGQDTVSAWELWSQDALGQSIRLGDLVP